MSMQEQRLQLIRETYDKVTALWQEFSLDSDPDTVAIKKLEKAVNLIRDVYKGVKG